MIPETYITGWIKHCNWRELAQIEQDLIITRAILDIYSQDYLRSTLAFRGGTALNKLFFNPASRYSEDIDLVQIKAEPIGEILSSLRSTLDPWLEEPKRNFSEGLVTLIYKVMSEDNIPLKLKVEINSREHFTELGFQERTFSSESPWAPGVAKITTYALEELLGTKLRALYQRRKGRDLYDLYIALITFPDLNSDLIIACFKRYMSASGKPVSKSIFLENMDQKIQNESFRNDIRPLLPLEKRYYDPLKAYDLVKEKILEKL